MNLEFISLPVDQGGKFLVRVPHHRLINPCIQELLCALWNRFWPKNRPWTPWVIHVIRLEKKAILGFSMCLQQPFQRSFPAQYTRCQTVGVGRTHIRRRIMANQLPQIHALAAGTSSQIRVGIIAFSFNVKLEWKAFLSGQVHGFVKQFIGEIPHLI